MSFEAHVAEDRRLCILRCLAEDADYGLNEELLADLLGRFGHRVSRDALRADLAWLAEQGLAGVETIADLHVARLTARGLDVAHGRAVVPGVKRPTPRG